MKISESIVYVISQLIFLGGREIAHKEAKYCRKFRQNFRQNFGENFVSSKFHQNRNTTWHTGSSGLHLKQQTGAHFIVQLTLFYLSPMSN